MNCGADKISINTAAIKNPLIISEAKEAVGSQCIVVAIDAKKVKIVGRFLLTEEEIQPE